MKRTKRKTKKELTQRAQRSEAQRSQRRVRKEAPEQVGGLFVFRREIARGRKNMRPYKKVQSNKRGRAKARPYE